MFVTVHSWNELFLFFIVFTSLHSVLGYRPLSRSFVRRSAIKSTVVAPTITKSNVISREVLRSIGQQFLLNASPPSKKDEAWRPTSLHKLFPNQREPASIRCGTWDVEGLRTELSRLVDARCAGSYMVLVNGAYVPSLGNITSIAGRVITGGMDAIVSNSYVCEDLKGRAGRMATQLPDVDEAPRDSFGSSHIAALTMANCFDTHCLVVPDGVDAGAPLQVLVCHVQTDEEGQGQGQGQAALAKELHETQIAKLSKAGDGAVSAFPLSVSTTAAPHSASYPWLMVLLGRNSSLKLLQSHHTVLLPMQGLPATSAQSATPTLVSFSGGPKAFVAATTSVALAEGATLHHTYMQEAAESASHLEVITADLHGNSSRYDLAVVQHGATASRVNVHVDIRGESANCSLNGVTLAGPRQSLDLHTSIRHNSTRGTSRQQHRNVVADRGEAIFKGRIRIPKHAQRTDSGQLCRSVLLGTRARLQVMPTLEISADDVACSHGASVADMDENSMFYLSARGIDRQEARRLMLRGFVFDMLRDCELDPKVEARLMQKLQSLHESETGRPATAQPSVQKYLSI